MARFLSVFLRLLLAFFSLFGGLLAVSTLRSVGGVACFSTFFFRKGEFT